MEATYFGIAGLRRCHLFGGGGGDRDGFYGVAEFAPGIQAALQRADAPDALFSEEQRHTGAGGFVWSSTVENDFAVARQAIVFLFQFVGVHAKRAGNRFRVSFEVHGVAQVNDDQFLAGVNFLLQFFRSDARNAQVAQEFLPGIKFPADIAGKRSDNQNCERTAQSRGALCDALDLFTKDVAGAEDGPSPDQRAKTVEKQELACAHVENSRERRRHSAQSGNEFREQQRTRALLGKDAFGAANAGVRFKRNFAEKLQDANTFPAAEGVPDGVGGKRGDGDEK